MKYSLTPVHSSTIRHAQRDAKLYGEHVTLEGEHVTREHCIIESIELSDEREAA